MGFICDPYISDASPWSNAESYDFNGSNGYIVSTDILDCDRLEALSIAFWIKIDSFPVSGQTRPIHKRDGVDEGWWVGVHNSDTIRFAFENATGDVSQIESSTLSTGTWYHVMCIATSAGKRVADMDIYIDNVVDTNSVTDNITSNATTTSSVMYIGSTSVPDNYFDGHLDEFGGWVNHEFTAGERSDAYNGGTTHDLMALANPPDHLFRADGDTTGAGNVIDHGGIGGGDGTINGGVTISNDVP